LRAKYRCPKANWKRSCFCEHPCSPAKYGRTVHIFTEDNPRLFNIPPRNSKNTTEELPWNAPISVRKRTIIKPKTFENKGFRRYELASIRGFEPPTPRLGVDPIRHREVASNA